MSEKKESEQGIILLMDDEVAQEFIENKIFVVMKTFSHVKYAVVLLEDDDDLRVILKKFQPAVLIFDNEMSFSQGKHKYSAYDLMQRIIQQHQKVIGMMFTSNKLAGDQSRKMDWSADLQSENIVWFEKLKEFKRTQPGILAVQNILTRAFG